MDGVLGYTTLFAGNFAPYKWAFCQGQIIPIQQNTALFSILGTTYGGNGTSNFQLPNLQGCAVIGAGQGAGLSSYTLGENGGSESVSILSNQIPLHTHPVSYTIIQDSTTATTTVAATTNNAYGADNSGVVQPPYIDTTNVSLKPFAGNLTMQNTGIGSPIATLNPYMALNYIICLSGAFPPRP